MEITERFIQLLQENIGESSIKVKEPMKNHTSFRIGGDADIMVLPGNYEDIRVTMKICKEHDVPFFVMGNGSNLLVSDEGIRGVVIKTFKSLNRVKVDGEIIEAESGVLLSRLANIALENELTGLEFTSGIPGTLGGAIVMNAGAYDGEMKQVVLETTFIDEDGNIRTVKGDAHGFGYRTSVFQNSGKVIISSKIGLKKGNKQCIRDKMNDLNERRRQKQPLDLPSAGSVFKRPEGYFAGKLIEDCGLKGYRIGDAQVSEKHGGFIVNLGNAKAKEVMQLIEHIKKTVKDKFGVDLHTEIKII
ncbi:MAG: UDP-N-acetylmuramate dehydrogenase [Clostridiaceae bacterium]|nr:UDP-N-acetylmuramate dehydrogenase [Clostridiaceae bacterium]